MTAEEIKDALATIQRDLIHNLSIEKQLEYHLEAIRLIANYLQPEDPQAFLFQCTLISAD